MKSFELMRVLIPEKDVKTVAAFTGLSASLLYQERRDTDGTQTGTRNTIDRLDMFCKLALRDNPIAVRILGERYQRLYDERNAEPKEATVEDLLVSLGFAASQCGLTIAACARRTSVGSCTVEVTQAKASLERALAIVRALEEQQQQ